MWIYEWISLQSHKGNQEQPSAEVQWVKPQPGVLTSHRICIPVGSRLRAPGFVWPLGGVNQQMEVLSLTPSL